MGRPSGDPHAPHFVYRCFDGAGTLLYVGVTANLVQRFGGHSHTAAWWTAFARYSLIGPFVGQNARRRAMRCEQQVIESERPTHNVERAVRNEAIRQGRLRYQRKQVA